MPPSRTPTITPLPVPMYFWDSMPLVMGMGRLIARAGWATRVARAMAAAAVSRFMAYCTRGCARRRRGARACVGLIGARVVRGVVETVGRTVGLVFRGSRGWVHPGPDG